jgi:hypothetical protein
MAKTGTECAGLYIYDIKLDSVTLSTASLVGEERKLRTLILNDEKTQVT